MRIHLLILLSVGLVLSSCSDNSEPQSVLSESVQASTINSESVSKTQELNTWLDAQFDEQLQFSPLAKTRLGDKSDYGQLDDVSEASLDRQLAWRRSSVEQMRAQFDRESLGPQGQLSWDLWEYQLETAELNLPFRRHSYIFGRNGPQSRLPNNLINLHNVDTVADMDAYISRLQKSQTYMLQYLERAKLSVADGIRAPFFDYDRAISELARVTSGAPFDESGMSALWTDINSKMNGLLEQNLINQEQAQDLTEQARAALLENFKPAYDEIRTWLIQDRANASEVAQGVSELPNGEEYYNARLRTMTTLAMTADEIHETGIAEVARIQIEMEGIKRTVGFEGSLQSFFNYMRESDQFYYENTDQGRDDYLALADTILEEMYKKLPDYFGILPKAGLIVKRVEAFRENAGGAAHYRSGTKDGSRPGTFYVHLTDMRATAVNRLENLSYHEGVPGHHLQRSIQQELDNVPKFRANGGYTAFTEGWGLYAELLGKEMGGYNDPYADMGRLSGEIWRAVRLVVDTGIHAKGWTQDQAVQYALDNSPRPELSVRSEVERYFNNPGQATAYKIGMLKILEFRAHAEAELGDKFDIRAFHDTVLGSGPLPMEKLEEQINRWIESVR